MDQSTSYYPTDEDNEQTFGLASDLPEHEHPFADPFGGNTWALTTWADDDSQLDAIRPDWDPNRLDTVEALEAAQTWEEVLSCPVVTRDDASFLHPMASGRWIARTQVPVAQRPERGTIRHTRADGTVVTLAADGSPLTEKGTSSKRAAAALKGKGKELATKRAKSDAKLARLFGTGHNAPVAAAPVKRQNTYVIVNGEAVDYR